MRSAALRRRRHDRLLREEKLLLSRGDGAAGNSEGLPSATMPSLARRPSRSAMAASLSATAVSRSTMMLPSLASSPVERSGEERSIFFAPKLVTPMRISSPASASFLTSARSDRRITAHHMSARRAHVFEAAERTLLLASCFLHEMNVSRGLAATKPRARLHRCGGSVDARIEEAPQIALHRGRRSAALQAYRKSSQFKLTTRIFYRRRALCKHVLEDVHHSLQLSQACPIFLRKSFFSPHVPNLSVDRRRPPSALAHGRGSAASRLGLQSERLGRSWPHDCCMCA